MNTPNARSRFLLFPQVDEASTMVKAPAVRRRYTLARLAASASPARPEHRPSRFILTGSVAGERKLSRMNEQHTESRTPTGGRMQSFGRHALAALVLLVCAWILLHLLFHVVIVVATIIAVVVAIIGAVWAVRVLF